MTHKPDASLTLPARHPFVPSALFCAFALLVLALPLHAQQDIKGSTDHPLFPNRMPGFALYYYQQRGYSNHSFHGQPGQSIEGKLTKLQYLIKKNAANPGDLAIRRNYENAIKAAGGEVVYCDAFYSVMKITRARKEVWAEVVTRRTDV